MKTRRASRGVRSAGRSWWAAPVAVAVAIAAAFAGGCATEPPPRPVQIDPANPGAPESRPLEVSGGPRPEVSERTPARRADSVDDRADERPERQQEPPHQHQHQHQDRKQEPATPPRPQPEHQHESGGGGAP